MVQLKRSSYNSQANSYEFFNESNLALYISMINVARNSVDVLTDTGKSTTLQPGEIWCPGVAHAAYASSVHGFDIVYVVADEPISADALE